MKKGMERATTYYYDTENRMTMVKNKNNEELVRFTLKKDTDGTRLRNALAKVLGNGGDVQQPAAQPPANPQQEMPHGPPQQGSRRGPGPQPPGRGN